MSDDFDDDESDAEVAHKVADGLEIMAAYCAIESAELRRAVKRIVMTLAGRTADKPDCSQLRGYAAPARDTASLRGESDD